MNIRLYDSAWVELEGMHQPVQVRRDLKNLAAFNAAEFQYDIDGRPLAKQAIGPKIVRLHNLQSARDAGLPMTYELSRATGRRQGEWA